MVNAKEPAKMLATKTPVREKVNFLESGQSWCWQSRTVSSNEGVVKSISELGVKGWLLGRRECSKSMCLRPYSVANEEERESDVAGSRVSQPGPR